MTVQNMNKISRKQQVGRIVFSDQGLCLFAGYHSCDCGNKGKVLLSLDDARFIASKIGGRSNQVPLGARAAKWLDRRYGVNSL